MSAAPDIILVALLGLVLGSFATALAHRLPLGISLSARARSQCPACGHRLGPLDLVPLFSWLFLRGKCRYCKTAIGARYPLIELATMGLCLLFYAVYGLSLATLPVYALAPVLVALTDIDFRHRILPDGLNLSILLIGLAALLLTGASPAGPLAGAAAWGLGSLLLRQGAQALLKKEAMGLGDVKFFAAAGFWLGLNPEAAAVLMVVAGVSGTLMALGWKKATGEAESPFGPALIAAFIVVLCLFPPSFYG